MSKNVLKLIAIQGDPKICVKNVKVGRRDLNKHILDMNMCPVMTH